VTYSTRKKVIKIAERIDKLKQKYPMCPVCKASGKKGLVMTKLGNVYGTNGNGSERIFLRCRACNSMFIFELDDAFRVKIIDEIQDEMVEI